MRALTAFKKIKMETHLLGKKTIVYDEQQAAELLESMETRPQANVL